jgi:hypothetical protein
MIKRTFSPKIESLPFENKEFDTNSTGLCPRVFDHIFNSCWWEGCIRVVTETMPTEYFTLARALAAEHSAESSIVGAPRREES